MENEKNSFKKLFKLPKKDKESITYHFTIIKDKKPIVCDIRIECHITTNKLSVYTVYTFANDEHIAGGTTGKARINALLFSHFIELLKRSDIAPIIKDYATFLSHGFVNKYISEFIVKCMSYETKEELHGNYHNLVNELLDCISEDTKTMLGMINDTYKSTIKLAMDNNECVYIHKPNPYRDELGKTNHYVTLTANTPDSEPPFTLSTVGYPNGGCGVATVPNKKAEESRKVTNDDIQKVAITIKLSRYIPFFQEWKKITSLSSIKFLKESMSTGAVLMISHIDANIRSDFINNTTFMKNLANSETLCNIIMKTMDAKNILDLEKEKTTEDILVMYNLKYDKYGFLIFIAGDSYVTVKYQLDGNGKPDSCIFYNMDKALKDLNYQKFYKDKEEKSIKNLWGLL